jgi:hypothetical protein
LFLLLAAILIFFAVQSTTFQTWLGRRAGAYLGSELGNKVSIRAINLEFFSKANLEGVLILDKHNDTILHGDLLVDISKFNYRQQKISIDRITLRNVTSKLIRYRADTRFNYQFLIDYFDTGKKDTVHKSKWEVTFGEAVLQNVAFVYRKEKFVTPVTRNINFEDLYLRNTYGRIDRIRIEEDTVYATVTGLRTTEQSGFELSSLSTNAKISDKQLLCRNIYLKTPRTFVRGQINFTCNSWDDYQEFVEKVNMDARLEDSTYVSFTDIAAFASELNGLDETVKISGEVKGRVNDMRLKNLHLAYGHDTKFIGNLTLSGLPETETSYLHFDAKELSTSQTDLSRIPSYPFSENTKIQLPAEAARLGKVSYSGKFDGFISDFTTYGTFKTALGNLTTNMSIKTGENAEDVAYHGELSTTHFNLGTLLGQNDFNGLSLSATIKGRGISIKTLDADFEGMIRSLTYNKYEYNNIRLSGSMRDNIFSGLMTSKDPNADFDFNGTVNFKNKVPEMDFISTINNLSLKQLNFTNSADSGRLSSQILINIRGDNIDNLSGVINFDNTIYTTKTRTYKLSTFNILMDQDSPAKKIKLNSGYINALVWGTYNLSNLKPAFESLLFNYYPTFFKKTPLARKKYSDQLEFRVTVKKFNTINELFIPDLMLAPGTAINGNFNAAANKLNLQFNSAQLNYKALQATELVMILNENKNTVLGEVSGKELRLSDSLNMANFNFVVNSVDRESHYSLDWDNLKQPANKGEIKGSVYFDDAGMSISNEKIAITLNDSTWRLKNPGILMLDKAGILKVQPLELNNNLQSLLLSGTFSEHAGDSLVIATHNLVLRQFNPLLNSIKLKAEGVMNGNIMLSNADKNLAFNGDISLTQLKINDNTIGELKLRTNYNAGAKHILLNGYTSLGFQDELGNPTKNIAFNGTYYLDRQAESIDINFSAHPANLKLLNPLLEGIITINNGFVNGEGKVHGTPDHIEIDGKLKLFNSEVKVDYTNVTYNLSGDIEIMPDQIRFSDLMMREKGSRAAPQGTINGNIFHSNFSRMQIDYDVTYRNMLVLNTTEADNNTYYGKVYGSGRVNIYGFLNNLNMEVDNTTSRNSRFILPLDGPAEIGDNDFIQFVKRDTVKVKKEKDLSGFNLDMRLHATPDAQVQIILDKQHGDMLNVQGQGDLKLTVNTLGKFEMFGDYIITNGDYLFTLENVINKKFDIDAGSSISWSGNPLNAEIDVVTSYRQRASVAPLLNDTTGQYKGRFPVDCKLLITGKLFSPNINFAIDFPNIDATARARINNVLSDEAELNRQVFSFLLFRSFVTPQIFKTTGGGVSAGGAAASTGSELLSNRVSEFLNTYVGNLTGISDLQLGLNYRPGNQNNTQAVDLALSKQFLNNKITVDGNFGVNNSAQARSNGLIGDVNIDYKLSEDGRYRLKGFNRTNDNTQITTAGGQYTQGIGFFYREEFETFSQLFKRYLKKNKKKDKPKP